MQISNFKDDSSPVGESLLLHSRVYVFLEANEVHSRFLHRVIVDMVFALCLLTAWDCSGWVRTYALFLEERLECFRVLKYDIEAERLPKVSPGQEKVSNLRFTWFSGLILSPFLPEGIRFWK